MPKKWHLVKFYCQQNTSCWLWLLNINPITWLSWTSTVMLAKTEPPRTVCILPWEGMALAAESIFYLMVVVEGGGWCPHTDPISMWMLTPSLNDAPPHLQLDQWRNVHLLPWLQKLASRFSSSITFLMATILFLDFHCPFHTCPKPPVPTVSMNSRSANSILDSCSSVSSEIEVST